jgi:hypothetical protein
MRPSPTSALLPEIKTVDEGCSRLEIEELRCNIAVAGSMLKVTR